MAEGAVRLGHLVRVFTSLDRRAEAIHGIDELGGELLAHALAVALASRLDEPADTERQTTVAPDLDRDLIGRATDAARAKSGKPMAERLAEEILAANKKEGVAFKKREDTHKMAEANRAFAHYRW
jgi:hypothetical protein